MMPHRRGIRGETQEIHLYHVCSYCSRGGEEGSGVVWFAHERLGLPLYYTCSGLLICETTSQWGILLRLVHSFYFLQLYV